MQTMSEALDFIHPLPDDDSHKWSAIERSLKLTTQAESLRERSRMLREKSRLIREDSTRITMGKLLDGEIPPFE